ncbi:MAG TPA: BolA/IbaG family iron-sulfur metabolism protein [Buchnera sp. (in: enterobacteria)]|nr:BolA/IbaG family iron-sulfur metabolism protein [Buchnera sp. (in: enterobacteria)]
MNNKKIEKLLKHTLSLQEIYVTGDSNHTDIIAVGEIFTGMSEVTRQQSIYKPLISDIMEKKIHAVSIKSYTPKEWNKKKHTYNL